MNGHSQERDDSAGSLSFLKHQHSLCAPNLLMPIPSCVYRGKDVAGFSKDDLTAVFQAQWQVVPGLENQASSAGELLLVLVTKAPYCQHAIKYIFSLNYHSNPVKQDSCCLSL